MDTYYLTRTGDAIRVYEWFSLYEKA